MEDKIFNDCFSHYKRNDKNFWGTLAGKYGSTKDALRSEFKRELAKRNIPSKASVPVEFQESVEKKVDGTTISTKLLSISDVSFKDPHDLLQMHGLDPSKYILLSYKNSMWGADKLSYSSCITAKPIDIPLWTPELFDSMLTKLKLDTPVEKNLPVSYAEYETLVVNIADPHFGLLATKTTSNNEYNLDIAETRFNETMEQVYEIIEETSPKRIVLVIGNDFLNFDNLSGTTTAGTPQDNSTIWFDVIDKVTWLLVSTIDKLMQYATLSVIYVPSNHDLQSMYGIMKVLEYRYGSNMCVDIDSSALPRKYIEIGKNLFGFTHNLPMKEALKVITTEQDEAWGRCSHVYLVMAHYHQAMAYERDGKLEIFRVPTFSGWSRWSSGKAYTSDDKRSQCFMVSDTKGITRIYNIIV